MLIYDAYKLLRLKENNMMTSYYVPENSKYNIYYSLNTVINKIENTHGIFCFDTLESVIVYLNWCNISLIDTYQLILNDTKKMIGVLTKLKTNKSRYIYSAAASTDALFLDKYYKSINYKWPKLGVGMHEGVIVTDKILIDSSENIKLTNYINEREAELEELNMNVFN